MLKKMPVLLFAFAISVSMSACGNTEETKESVATSPDFSASASPLASPSVSPNPSLEASIIPSASPSPAVTDAPTSASPSPSAKPSAAPETMKPSPTSSVAPITKPSPASSAKPSVPTSSPENADFTNQENSNPSESISANPTPVAFEALTLFKQNCMSCHGAELEGKMIGPNLQKVGARLSKEKIIDQITKGDTMPPFKDKLNKQEIETLANWLATKK